MPHGRTPLAPCERLLARDLAARWLHAWRGLAADHANPNRPDDSKHVNDFCVGGSDADPDRHLEPHPGLSDERCVGPGGF